MPQRSGNAYQAVVLVVPHIRSAQVIAMALYEQICLRLFFIISIKYSWIKLFVRFGRGALILRRSRIVKYGGAVSSENAGISNLKTGENPVGRKSKVSRATVIVPGLVGPKPRRISVGDGHQVNIPEQVVVVNSSQYVTGAVSW